MIEITQAAAERLQIMADKKGVELIGVRVAVLGGGCAGMSYDMDFEDTADPDDLVFGDHPKIFVDPKSHEFLKGTVLEFTDGLKGVGFVFKNPNADSTCGCGTSFSV
jgi:iron-sulfur cluster assembly accessory protein